MGKNKNATKPLTQEEIWDDSALVQSWDEAVEEYKVRGNECPVARDSQLIMMNSSIIASMLAARMSRMS